MAIESVSLFNPAQINPTSSTPKISPFEAQQNFGDFLKSALESVNANQKASDVVTEKLIRGENVELHDVMIASQKASITLNATMEIRNKVIEAYQEIMRMPV
ncbi:MULTISPECIES: flagellar hook-basal body complex protein FliE [Bacillaceae]|uniref:flagellar hook-basal body complex protein FliE n=1 Tax=Bacillaceae TaxID=186817 RepID=UPI000701706A|nr:MULTISPECIES: flagellar hook-basal body complex protein FliE [Bacillaceae]KQL35511.1 flagellar hook-basal body protein FliE [Psychrobacillus sp. FJAT-21963]MDF2066009.1 flagellar hook-basal body complex protein FliE [Bacillus sp. Cr_A10]